MDVSLVTRGGRGRGLACARRLGARRPVVVEDIDADSAARAAGRASEELGDRGGRASMRDWSRLLIGLWIVLGVSRGASAGMQEPEAASPSGDLFTRSQLTGSWQGVRTDLAAKGITFDASVTQIEQGVVSGGKSGAWEYGGRGDLVGRLDTDKLGLWPGGFLTTELEGNWSTSVNGRTGALLPVNTSQLLPLPPGGNVALPELSFTQFVSRYVGLSLGKFQTMSTGDLNEFAHGKGDTQFFNLAFNINPVSLVVPYSTLGAGAIVLPTADPHQALLKFVVLSATGKASTSGFDNLDGAIFAGEGRVRTELLGLSGHQLVGGLYSNKRYTSVDQRLDLIIGNRALVPKDGTWAVYYNFDQFLYEREKGAGRGIGLFGRFGASAGDPVPVQYFYSAGLGARGLFASRPLDQFGIGAYYGSINNPTLQLASATRTFLGDEWGFEAYYNVALTPWFLLTPDVQVIGPSQEQQMIGGGARRNISTATVLGVRGQFIF